MLYEKQKEESQGVRRSIKQWRVAGGLKLDVIRWRLTNVKPSATTLCNRLDWSNVARRRTPSMPVHQIRAFNVGAIFGG